MAEFRYKARDASGGVRSGVVDAPNRSSAASQIRSRGLIVTGVYPAQQRVDPKAGEDWTRWLPIRSVDVELSLQQMAMMVRGGMSLLSALDSLQLQAPRKSLGNVWNKVIKKIQSGDSLSAAISEHRCFPEFTVQLIRVGERTGELPPVLERAVETMRANSGAACRKFPPR